MLAAAQETFPNKKIVDKSTRIDTCKRKKESRNLIRTLLNFKIGVGLIYLTYIFNTRKWAFGNFEISHKCIKTFY